MSSMAASAPGFEPEALAGGLRSLRAKGLACDVELAVGAERIRAHQVVLAAASEPLLEYFLSEDLAVPVAPEDPLTAQPAALELKLEGLSQPAAAKALVEHIYGSAAEAAEKPAGAAPAPAVDMTLVAKALGVQGFEAAGTMPDPTALAEGLRKLRARGQLCDALVCGGGGAFAAHQAVLAAASDPLRRQIADALRKRSEAAGRKGVSSEPVEIELEGSQHPDAVRFMLDYVYGSAAVTPVTEAENQEVIRLATSLELPRLVELAARVMARCRGAKKAAEAAEAAAKKAAEAPKAPEPAADAAASDAAARASAAREPTPVEEPQEMPQEEEEQEEPAKDNELEQALQAMKSVKYDDQAKVPEAMSARSLKSKQELKVYEKLRDLFQKRPVWLQGPLQANLGSLADESTLMCLLPLVAYQFTDGPWVNAYTRRGWDPRRSPDEAKDLQVIEFRDPFFRAKKNQHLAKEVSDAPLDFHFKHAPTRRTQAYQLRDIQDAFINELVAAAPPEEEICKKTGWVGPCVMEAVRDRLTIKGADLRDRAEARAAAGGKRAAGAGAGALSKRARTVAGG